MFIYVQARYCGPPQPNSIVSSAEELSFNHCFVMAETEDGAYSEGPRIIERRVELGKASGNVVEYAGWPLVNDYAVEIVDMSDSGPIRLMLDDEETSAG